MKKRTSRRIFLSKTAIATTGLAFLSTETLSAFTKDTHLEGYNQFAEEKTDLRTSILGNHVQIEGVVFDKTGSIPLSNATIEVWHLSPNSTKYRHRAKLKTNQKGAYRFITDFPQRETAKTPKIFFKITHEGETYFTELAVDQTGAYITSKHWEQSQGLGEKLFPVTSKFLNKSNINFNLLIN